MTQTALPQTSTFHQPTTGTAASPTATCTTCGRGIARMNGGSALWIDADGHVSCAPKPVATQTPAPNTFLAADVEVTVGGSFHAVKMDFTDDNPSRVATVALLGEASAYRLLNQLAAALGATVITQGQQQDLGLLVRETIADADERKNTPAAVGSSAVLLNTMTDAMRDLRDTFRRAGVISG